MRVLTLALPILLAMVGCDKTEQPPKNMVAADTLAMLLADMTVLETAQNTKALTSDSVKYSYEALYAAMFAHYGVTNARYDSTMAWLSTHPSDLEKIYDQVIEHLAERESANR